jgi:hypothetical protein
MGGQAAGKFADHSGRVTGAVLELAPEDRGDRAAVNHAAARVPDPNDECLIRSCRNSTAGRRSSTSSEAEPRRATGLRP